MKQKEFAQLKIGSTVYAKRRKARVIEKLGDRLVKIQYIETKRTAWKRPRQIEKERRKK